MERGRVDDIFYRTAHPYTEGLLSCIPSLDGPRDEPLVPIPGAVADPRRKTAGCPFAPRCARCMGICLKELPPEFDLGNGHGCACWLAVDALRSASNEEEVAAHVER